MEKAPKLSTEAKQRAKFDKKEPYGSPLKLRNEGPVDDVSEKFLKKPAKAREAKKTPETKAASAGDVAKVVGPKHQEMLYAAEQEANERREQEKLTNIVETVEILEEKSAEAERQGDKGLSKQLQDASRELVKRLEQERSIRTTREFVKNDSNEELGRIVDAVVRESRRREAERDGGAQSVPSEATKINEVMSGVDDQTLENIVQGLREEIRGRTAKRDAELATQIDEDLKVAGGEGEVDAAALANLKDSDARIAKLQEKLKEDESHEANMKDIDSRIEALKAKLHEDLTKEEAARAGKVPFPTVLQEIKDKNAPKVRVVKDAGTTETRLQKSKAANKDRDEWREHFGPLADIQEETERVEKKTNEDRAAWREHFGPLAEIQEEIERSGAVQKPEKGAAQEISNEKLTEAVRQAAAERAEAIEQKTPEEHKGFLRRMGERWRGWPRWKKFLIGGVLLGGAIGSSVIGGPASAMAWGFWLAQRGVAGLGGYALVDAATERWKDRYVAGLVSGGAGIAAMFLPSAVQYLDHNYFHVGDWIREHWLSSGGGKGNPLFDPNPTAGAPGWIEHAATVAAGIEHLFDQSVVVSPDDSTAGLWGILEDRLKDANIIDDNTSQGKINRMLVFLEDKFRDLGADGVKKLGFVSGDINIIHPGEKLDLSFLDKEGWITQAKLLR